MSNELMVKLVDDLDRPLERPAQPLSRRDMLRGTVAVTATLMAGCAGTILNGEAPLEVQDDPNVNDGPVWDVIPNQTWVIGVPVYLDLTEYCVDPEGDALIFELDRALPPGVTLEGSVISGTPTAEFDEAWYQATADDLG